MKNGHGIISMATVTSMPECTTHPLRLPKQDEEWTWNHQHDQSPTCQNAQLTSYDCQKINHKDTSINMTLKTRTQNTPLPRSVETTMQAHGMVLYPYRVWEMQTQLPSLH